VDTLTYLPGDILVKVDRATMANSLEGRIPFLDHRVIEFAWSMPFDMRLRGNTGKWALRELLYTYVPRSLVERPKAGFAVPVERWLRTELRDWAEELLGEERLRREGYLNAQLVRDTWKALLNGAPNLQHRIWNVLMFQAWLEDARSFSPNRVEAVAVRA
jgi:asparagine synthase (glutamine-hydrolysing)